MNPVHLEPCKYYVGPVNWVDDFYAEIGDGLEGAYWHDEHYHDGADYGGHYKTSKTKKEMLYPLSKRRKTYHKCNI